jgi:hypothetical protein
MNDVSDLCFAILFRRRSCPKWGLGPGDTERHVCYTSDDRLSRGMPENHNNYILMLLFQVAMSVFIDVVFEVL